MAGGGWEKTLLPRGAAVMDVLEALPGAELPPFNANLAWGPEGAKKASPNHETEAWCIEAARAAIAFARSGADLDLRDFERARDVLLTAFFPREFQEGPLGVGLWASEQFCPDNHGGQHLVSTMARIAAVISEDPELLTVSARLMRTTAQALLSVAAPDLSVWAPGMRPVPKKVKGPNGERLYNLPVSGVATEWLRELLSVPHGPALDSRVHDIVKAARVRKNWTHPQYLAVRALRWLRWRGDLATWVPAAKLGDPFLWAAPCFLKLKMTVWRSRGGHLAIIDQPRSRPGAKPITGVCDWVWCPYPTEGRTELTKLVQCGFDWQTLPPLPPKGSQMVVFPGRSGL